MANISGKNGLLKVGTVAIADVRKISIDFKSNNPQFAHSGSPGHKVSVAGVKSGDVSFDLVLKVDARQDDDLKVGEAFTLLVYETSSVYWTVPIRIDSMSQEIDINEGGEMTQSYKASCNGAWTYPDGTVSS